MRVVTVVGVLLAAGAGGAATLSAQHAHQLEIGGFGSYTRYDKLFLLDNQVGGGGRLGFFFNETLGLEVDANIAYPFPKAGGPHTQMRFGSVSLVLNSGGQKNILCLLGGYSRLDMGVNPPYNFALHAVNAGLATGSSSAAGWPCAWRRGATTRPRTTRGATRCSGASRSCTCSAPPACPTSSVAVAVVAAAVRAQQRRRRSRRRSAIPSSRRAARSPPRPPPSRRVRGAAHASRSGPATGPTNGIGAHRAASLSSRPTTTATPLSRRSAGIG